MTLFLRDNNNHTIVDIEVFSKNDGRDGKHYIDVRSIVVLEPYSVMLLSHPNKWRLIKKFSELSELRGWFWESYKIGNDEPTHGEVVQAIKKKLEPIANEFSLHIVED